MTYLKLVYPDKDDFDDPLDLIVNTLQIDNWRAVGKMPNEKFYLITHDCKVYHIKDFTIPKFTSLIKTGLEMTLTGTFDSVALMCLDCSGRGITDWISNITGNNIEVDTLEITFLRDSEAPLYKTTLNFDGEEFSAHFSHAVIPELHQQCKTCKGTGLFMISQLQKQET